jgi:hypothetical protein
MEEIKATIIPEEEKDDDLLVCCMIECAMDIFSKRKDDGYNYSLIGRYMMDSGMKIQGIFQSLEKHFPFY